ncbi:hypothetical protein BASA81_004387 [Batrachochytrium salamandrivorans]|nr:hypothetical protein BASA81_004387 [Batrachochytrium salamandrivorans]
MHSRLFTAAAGPGMSRPPKTSTNSKDILSFLDEIDASPAVTASTTAALPGTTPPAAMQSAVPPKPKPMAAATATLHLPRPPTASLSPPTSITAASPSNNSPSDAICAPALISFAICRRSV